MKARIGPSSQAGSRGVTPMCEPEGVSTASADPGRPQNDSKIASVAWAIAAIVVALAAAFIAWLALGDRDSAPTSDGSPSATAEASAPDADATDPAAAGATDPAATDDIAPDPATQDPATQDPAGDAAAQTPPPDVVEFMLGLQRRDAEDVMAVGDVDAPVVMIEYADYRCPYCARFHLETRPELDALVGDGTLRIEFRDLVLFEETSELAAVASRAAAEQGHLEDFQTAVFGLSTEGHGEYTRDDLITLAEEVGVEDIDAFEAALDDEEILAQVQADTAEARAIGISSTPTFLINTQVVQGAYPIDHFRQVIEAEAAKAQATG